MLKRYLLVILLSILIGSILFACGDDNGGNFTAEDELDWDVDITGAFATEDGIYLSFYDTGYVMVSISVDEYLFILNDRDNDTAYPFTFMADDRQVAYEKANSLYLYEGTKSFAQIDCLTSQESIVLFPGTANETTLIRRTN